MFNILKDKFQAWKENRFLKKHGCETWEQFDYRYDTDVNKGAYNVRQYYYGYPYVHCLENQKHHAYEIVSDYGPGGVVYGFEEMNEWCKKNFSSKFRCDVLRVFPNSFWSEDRIESYSINDIGGHDLVFFAFKSELDYIWFVTRWG